MAHHNFNRDAYFNILTTRRDPKTFNLFFTGEAKNGIEIGDTINYPFGGFNIICKVDNFLQRRDAKAYPKGNGYYYECECVPFEMDSSFSEYRQPPKEEETKKGKKERL